MHLNAVVISGLTRLIKHNVRSFAQNCRPPWRVLFFGTDKFSIKSLESLHNACRTGKIIKHLEVVTTIKSNKANEVQKYAEKQNLILHGWPLSVPEDVYDVGIVVSFGHLIPEAIISKFKFGILNVHASLLPRWRGAAPIIYAIAKGDTETGITIMKIKPKRFDVGEIIMQESIKIRDDVKMGELHNSLAELGANCLLKVLDNLQESIQNARKQPEIGVTLAPKVDHSFAKIDWHSMTAQDIYNLERAVHGMFCLTSTLNGTTVKLQNVSVCQCVDLKVQNPSDLKLGYVLYDKQKDILKIFCVDGKWIHVKQVGVFGKKMMSATEFRNGYLNKLPTEKRCFE